MLFSKTLDKINKNSYFSKFNTIIMNINDKYVLEMLNRYIAIERLNKNEVLQMVNLVSLSNDINDLKENIKWEVPNSFH